MKKTIFDITLLLSVVVITLFVFTSADANTNIKAKKWMQCANKAVEKYGLAVRQDPEVFKKHFCDFLTVSVGPECDSKVQMLQVTGELVGYINAFSMKKVVEPACGRYPGE